MGLEVTPVTMKTLAEQLGVSATTVSNAYNKPDRLSAELREQILTRAKELGYCGPSAAGRALRSGKSGICGYLFGAQISHAFSDPYAVIFLSGLAEAVEEYAASVLLLRADGHDDNATLQRAPVDAVVTGPPAESNPNLDLLTRRGVRVVATMSSPDGDWVAIDDAKAGRLLGKHLAKLGHSRIVVVVAGDLAEGVNFAEVEVGPEGTLPPDFPGRSCGYAERRIAGLRAKLSKATIRVVCAGQNTREVGRAAGADVLDDQRRPTAIVALSDVLALGVWDAARERGLTPGRDVSIAGFDDLPDAAFVGLTSVHQPIAEKGRLAGLLAMDPDYPDRQILLPVELKVRASTGPAPLN